MLRRTGGERGSAPVEASFAIVLLMVFALGVVQVALALYARNVVMASAHEGARAAIELGRTSAEAAAVARETVRRATGRLVDDLEVGVAARRSNGRRFVTVEVAGVITRLGPVPLPIPLSSRATAVADDIER